MTGELIPTNGDIRPHGHLKMGRFTQHFVDVLNLDQTPLEFFQDLYPSDPRAEQCKVSKYLSICGCDVLQTWFPNKEDSLPLWNHCFVPTVPW